LLKYVEEFMRLEDLKFHVNCVHLLLYGLITVTKDGGINIKFKEKYPSLEAALSFMEPELSLPCPQEKNTASFPEPGEPSKHLIFCSLRYILQTSAPLHLPVYLLNDLFP
jgi:hypothetical protein